MLVDVHAHLQLPQFAHDLPEVIERCKALQFAAVINSGLNHESNVQCLALSKQYPLVKASLGLYPIDVLQWSEEQLDKEIVFIKEQKDVIISIGEIGMDFQESQERERQVALFKKILTAFEPLNKPIVIHSRKAEKECVEIIETTKHKKVLFHCFSGSFNLAKRIVGNGWYLSIPPIILRSLHFQGLVNLVPLDNILTETDSPYLAPPPKMRNEPAFVKKTIEKISELKNMPEKEIENIIYRNFEKLFLKS